MGAADPLFAELGLIGTGWAALAWAGLIGVAGWMRAELASPGPLRFRAPSPALGLRSVIVVPRVWFRHASETVKILEALNLLTRSFGMTGGAGWGGDIQSLPSSAEVSH